MRDSTPSPETVGTITLDPAGPFVAGSRHTLTLTYTAGESGIEVGGGLRVFPPHMGHTYWELGKVTAECSREGACMEVETFNDQPYTFHHSNPPYIRVTVWGQPLSEGDTITITIGEHGGYSSGYFRLARVATHAWRGYRFTASVDVLGNGRRPREFDRPDAFVELPDVPTLDIIADQPHTAHVVAKPPGEADSDQFELVISIRDRFGNLAEYEGALRVECDDPDASLPDAISVNEGAGPYGIRSGRRSEGAARVTGCHTSAPRARVTVYDPRQELIGTSNPIVPEFAGDERVYFGDLHVMSGQGRSGGMMLAGTEYAHRWARDVQGLDFSVVTNGGGEKTWEEDLRLDDEFDEPGRFVTIPAMERGFRRGHKNLYFRSSAGVPSMPRLEIEGMFEWLAELDVPALAIPHHTNCHSETSRYYGWGPQDFTTSDPRFERLIEITQDRGSFEHDEVGGAVSLGGNGSSVQDALAMGLRMGFVGGTDNHRAQPGSKRSNLGGLVAEEIINGGYTAVFAPELTREAVFDALWDRCCYATTSERILLRVALGEHFMGSDLSAEEAAEFADERNIRIEAVGRRHIDRIEIVRNNETVESVEIDEEEATLTYTDPMPLAEVPAVSEEAPDVVFYYVRLIEADGNRAWSSPIWLGR
ncbi:MAG: DUF3604 domain-containing protein [Armatimonadota bacterium]|nr:DUF3604 domain-containing protein [Armatimonadota bacterium]